MVVENNKEEVLLSYKKLVTDEKFDQLDLLLKKPNFFRALQVVNTEIKHSSFLAWLLDPNESHGLGELFIKRFLREVFSHKKTKDAEIYEAETLDYRSVKIFREKFNIDILIEIDNLIITIENKVWSGEGNNQLEKYESIILKEYPNNSYRHIFLFLTPEGLAAKDRSSNYISFSYSLLISIIERLLNTYNESLNTKVKIYLEDYLSVLKRDIMNNDEATLIANALYKNHKELFDFIMKNKNDESNVLQNFAGSFVQDKGFVLGTINKGFIRFISQRLASIVPVYPKQNNGWKNREAFLFEWQFEPQKNKHYLVATASPGVAAPELRTIFVEILQEFTQRAVTDFWTSYYIRSSSFQIDDFGSAETQINEVLSNTWSIAYPIINEIETKIISRETEIKAIADKYQLKTIAETLNQ